MPGPGNNFDPLQYAALIKALLTRAAFDVEVEVFRDAEQRAKYSRDTVELQIDGIDFDQPAQYPYALSGSIRAQLLVLRRKVTELAEVDCFNLATSISLSLVDHDPESPTMPLGGEALVENVEPVALDAPLDERFAGWSVTYSQRWTFALTSPPAPPTEGPFDTLYDIRDPLGQVDHEGAYTQLVPDPEPEP